MKQGHTQNSVSKTQINLLQTVHKLISCGINAFFVEINYSNVPRYLGTKLTRTNSNQIDGSLHCQLRYAGTNPLTGNDVASARLMKSCASDRHVPTANPVGITKCVQTHSESFKLFQTNL